MNEKKLKRVAQQAEDAFWAVVAENYEAKSGDLPPDMAIRLSSTMLKSIEVWVDFNVPDKTEKTDVDKLATQLIKKGAKVDGWKFDYEYPGSFAFYKKGWTAYCTPDFVREGYISLQVLDEDGYAVGDGDKDIPYKSPLTVEKFLSIMKEPLRLAEEMIKKAVRS